MTNKIIRKIRNLIGNFKGYGKCLRCEDRWNWKKYHVLNYTKDKGMFPLCQECWEESSKEERIKYVHILVNTWTRTYPTKSWEDFRKELKRLERKRRLAIKAVLKEAKNK